MDIALTYSNDAQRMDCAISRGDLLGDEGLETAVLLSLGLDREAKADDVESGDDRRGWWGDALLPVSGDRTGSRLWLLAREKLTEQTLRRAEDYAAEALRWMLDDGVAAKVACTAARLADSLLKLDVAIDRPGRVPARWQRSWEVHLNAL